MITQRSPARGVASTCPLIRPSTNGTAGHVDRPAARAIQRRPHELGPDPASRIGQRAVRLPARRRHALPPGQQAGPKTKPVRPGPGDSAAEAGRERVPGQAPVIPRSLPGLLEGDRLDLIETAGVGFCLRDDDVAYFGRQGCRRARRNQVHRFFERRRFAERDGDRGTRRQPARDSQQARGQPACEVPAVRRARRAVEPSRNDQGSLCHGVIDQCAAGTMTARPVSSPASSRR